MMGDANAVAVLGYHDGSAGQVATWFEEAAGSPIACFVHDARPPFFVDIEAENAKRPSKRTEFPRDGRFKSRPLIVSTDWVHELIEYGIRRVLPLTPNNFERRRQIAVCRSHGLDLVSAIHPSVRMLFGATVEPGVWINAASIIGYRAEIQSGVLINTGVQIDHHNVLHHCCQVDPGVVTAGNVTLGECSHVHTGATVINRIEVGAGAIIGAGAVVIRNIPTGTTAVGVPARVIRRGDSTDE